MYTTERLFYSQPYSDKFSAKITFVGDDYLILDQTLFYPLSGNQDYDLGYIDNVDNFQVGQEIEGIINPERRLNIMKLHAASHIVEHFITQKSGFISVEGSFVSAEKGRTDYKFETSFTPEDVSNLEEKVNTFILSGKEISFEILDGMRYWQCDGISMLCCGTHVLNTNEIGAVKLSRKNKGKGINRIEIKLTN
jgi:alanyl-tRNA synthetase